MTHAATTSHPWIGSLQAELDALEAAVLRGDAPGVEQASAALQAVLQQAPKAAAFAESGSPLRRDAQTAAQRFAQLRQAVLRASAHNERAVGSLLPQQALQRQPTYGRMVKPSSLGGAGRGFLSA
jgi:broad specificity phosphatase PhoE